MSNSIPTVYSRGDIISFFEDDKKINVIILKYLGCIRKMNYYVALCDTNKVIIRQGFREICLAKLETEKQFYFYSSTTKANV